MTVFLLQVCLVSACSNALSNKKQLSQLGKAIVVARRSTVPLRLRSHHRRNNNKSAPAIHSRRRRNPVPRTPADLHRISRSFAWVNRKASREKEVGVIAANPIDRAAVQLLFATGSSSGNCLVDNRHDQNSKHEGPSHRRRDSYLMSAMERMEGALPQPTASSAAHANALASLNGLVRAPSSETMPPPPPPGAGADDLIETRSTRSASSASRTTNRLSLTLPIAPPNALPSRPVPTPSTMGSCPPTPIDSSGLTSPAEPIDFITAIASQERRVLEMREELDRAERDLRKLKKEWQFQEAHKKRAELRRTEPLRTMPSSPSVGTNSDDPESARRSEMDRRKALLLAQQQGAQGTPNQSRRRVFRGGHTRTLSLLSPTKSTSGDFEVHEDGSGDPVQSPTKEIDEHLFGQSRPSPFTPSQLAKRASWAPRSVHQVSGLKQVADDFKAGLWTFVEDLRQATVGEELATGNGLPMRGVNVNGSTRARESLGIEDQDTIRASGATSRPHVATAFEETPTPPSRFSDPLGLGNAAAVSSAKTKAKRLEAKTKHSSWTLNPLAVDYDDEDWSNWDSPGPAAKSPRWSGTTVNGDDHPPGTDENGLPLKKEANLDPASALSPTLPKLEDIPWPKALKSLSPGNIQRTASDLMKEWEKSLAPPQEAPVAAGADNATRAA